MHLKFLKILFLNIMLLISQFHGFNMKRYEKDFMPFSFQSSLYYEKKLNKINYNGNDVILNLHNQIIKYTNLKNDIYESNKNCTEKINNINELISILQNMIAEYNNSINDYEYNINTTTLNNAETLFNINHTLIVNYFISKNYDLSAELLIHMKSNKEYNSIYHPVMIDNIEESTVFHNILSTNTRNGSLIFESSDDDSMQDLHYAINKFNYSKSDSNKCIVITDLYDFDSTLEYESIEKKAIDMMASAQNYGFLTPFYTVIELENDIDINNDLIVDSINVSDWKYNEFHATIGKLEDKYFSINFNYSGNKLIQTFGLKDTFLILFDENYNPLTFDNNNGYLNNSCISYYFEKNKKYIVKVSFYEDEEMGNVKLGITSNSDIKKYDDIQKINRTSNLFSYYYDDNIVESIQGNTNLYTLTPATKDNFDIFTDKINTYSDTYLVFIDPRNSELSTKFNKTNMSDNEIRRKNETMSSLYDDDSGSNLQAKILIGKHDVNTPYLLIVSNYNFYNDNNFLLKIDGMKSNKINIIF